MSTHGTFFWNELNTRDVEGAKAFYAATLGWSYEAMPMPGFTYTVVKAGDTTVGGIFDITGAEFEGIPSHWFAYIAVDDVDARIAKVAGAGGAVLKAPFDVPEVGRMGVVKDPTGAVVGWITPVPMPAG
ncbi:VOC family protein [Ancylobacter terrae]|uniref:VOC family protein n=1 Tax=Ancylobacter sp. sgz301288 TaxID=3342077 RepID=UPI00385CF2C5